MVSWLSQMVAVTWLNLRSLGQRAGASLVAVVGIAGVVAVFVAVLSMAEGFRKTLVTAGSRDTAVVFRSGSTSEMDSILSLEETKIIADVPLVARDSGRPLASAELFVIVNLPRRSTGTDMNVPLRGVQPQSFELRDEIQIVEGRMFEPGRNELIAGSGAARVVQGLELGSTVELGESRWRVVGIFEDGGGVAESELWCDAKVLQPAYRRGSTFQVVYAKLRSAGAFDDFKDALNTDPRLNVKVLRETEFYAEQSSLLYSIISGLGTLIGLLMGLGAVFGALNTMYSSVSARTREIATLRALGFGGWPVVVSVMAEALLLAAVGGLVGGGLAYLAFDGFHTATINWASFSQVAFAFAVTPGLLAQGILYALAMGFLGGLFPAVRAARLPVAAALREL